LVTKQWLGTKAAILSQSKKKKNFVLAADSIKIKHMKTLNSLFLCARLAGRLKRYLVWAIFQS
jgi:hypothetical protein